MENQALTSAIEFMKDSTSVANWNQRRQTVLNTYAGDQRQLLNEIDGKGLIVQVLGQDKLDNVGTAIRQA